MKDLTSEQMVEVLTKGMPYPEQITDWDFSSHPGHIHFTWRGTPFCVNLQSISVWERDGDLIRGSNLALIMKVYLKKVADEMFKRMLKDA